MSQATSMQQNRGSSTSIKGLRCDTLSPQVCLFFSSFLFIFFYYNSKDYFRVATPKNGLDRLGMAGEGWGLEIGTNGTTVDYTSTLIPAWRVQQTAAIITPTPSKPLRCIPTVTLITSESAVVAAVVAGAWDATCPNPQVCLLFSFY